MRSQIQQVNSTSLWWCMHLHVWSTSVRCSEGCLSWRVTLEIQKDLVVCTIVHTYALHYSEQMTIRLTRGTSSLQGSFMFTCLIITWILTRIPTYLTLHSYLRELTLLPLTLTEVFPNFLCCSYCGYLSTSHSQSTICTHGFQGCMLWHCIPNHLCSSVYNHQKYSLLTLLQ